MAGDEKYFNVPIQIFEGFMTDPGEVLDNVFDYAVYKQSLKLNGTELQQFKAALHWFGVTSPNHTGAISNGKRLLNKYPPLSPKVGISKTMYFDFYQNYKTDFEKICLLGFLALKSIVQNKPYCCIGNFFWLARMDGKVNAIKDFGELSDDIRRYGNEYQTVKIKRELRDAWGLKFYSYHLRGCYYSFTLSQDDLVFQAEKTRKKNKDLAAKKATQQARERALARLNVN